MTGGLPPAAGPAPAATGPGRFSAHGGAALDAQVAAQLEAVARDVLDAAGPERVDALVLGGGYGRGEGGVLRTPEGVRPFNDYDLVLVHHHPRPRRLAAALRPVERRHAEACGIHVDVTLVRRSRVARLPPALTWYELGQGHHVLEGDARLLEPLSARTLSDVHPTEWGRLLVNRSFGVALARRLHAGRPCPLLAAEDPRSAITRLVWKAWLAVGDAWLADRGAYHPLVRERGPAFEDRLARGLDAAPAWSDRYREALRFKLLPSLAPLPDEGLHLEELAALLPGELAARRAAPPRPLVGLWCTLRLVPASRWLASAPWRYGRERLRLGLSAELSGDLATRDRVCGSAEGLVRIWERYG